MKRWLLSCSVLVVGFVLGCSSDGASGATSGPTREQACAQAAQAFCDVYQKCLPLLITSAYAEEAKCVERALINCPSSFDAPSTTSTPAKVVACAGEISKVSCEQLSVSPPAACVPDPGGLEDGAACADDAQCKSTWCAKGDADVCGKCTKLPGAGDACPVVGTDGEGKPDKDCGRGLTCAKDVCVKPSVTGEPCSETKPCALGLACFGGKCVAAGKPGAKCDPAGNTDPPCDFFQGAYCNPSTKVCQLLGESKAGEACGVVGSDFKICVAGAKCITKGGASGTCIAPAADGAPCDATDGPPCLAPAQCVGGVCKLSDATACK